MNGGIRMGACDTGSLGGPFLVILSALVVVGVEDVDVR